MCPPIAFVFRRVCSRDDAAFERIVSPFISLLRTRCVVSTALEYSLLYSGFFVSARKMMAEAARARDRW
jgi:hypothetical protein